MTSVQNERYDTINILQAKILKKLTCSAEVFPFVLAEPGTPTAFLLLSLFPMAHMFCAGQEMALVYWLMTVT